MMATNTKTDRPSSRGEWLAIVAITLIGAGLRLWQFDRLGLTHFDEGIYAMTGLWPLHPDGLASYNPSTVVYAPPGFPILVGLAYMALGVSDFSAITVSIVVGILTIPVLGWIGRRGFGPGAGATAAALGAMSGAHVAFSRMALTDVSFLLTWLIALAIGGWFLDRPGVGKAILLGLAVGLSQNFKYNGWLSGVIVAVAALPRQGGKLLVPAELAGEALRHRGVKGRRQGGKLLALLALAGGVAALSYVPWYLFVDRQPGRYSGLIRHHSGYLKGIDAWLPHWKAQLDQSVALSGGLIWGLIAGLSAGVGGMLAVGTNGMRPRTWIVAISALIAAAVMLGALPNLPWWLALAGMPWLLRDDRPAVRVIAVSWLGLAILTPFYHPYARLWLPSTAAAWLIVGGMAADGWASLRGGSFRGGRARLGVAAIALVAAVATQFGLGKRPEAHDRLLGPSDSIRSDVYDIRRSFTDPGDPIALVGRPPVVYYGVGLGLFINRMERVEDLDVTVREKFALVEETQLRQQGDPDAILAKILKRWEIVTIYPEVVNIPTLLDEDPGAAFEPKSGTNGRLWFLRRRSGSPSR